VINLVLKTMDKPLKARYYASTLIGILIAATTNSAVFAAIDPTTLRSSIDEKAKALEEINKKIQETQQDLSETVVKGTTLKKELARIDYSVNQVSLGIKASEITIEKLGLEIDSLQDDIGTKEQQIILKRQTIERLLQEFQLKDSENLLTTFLKNQSLSQSLAETQTLADLNDTLLTDVAQIRKLKDDLRDRLNNVSMKKEGIVTEQQNLKTRKAIIEDQRSDRATLLSQTKNQEKAYQQMLSELEKQQQEISNQIEAIEAQLRLTFDPSLLPSQRPGVFAYPVTNPRKTQDYGATKFAQRAYKSKFHNGVDFGGPIGTPILAAEDGVVTMAGNNGRVQYGRYILIKHGNNLSTLYAHLSRQFVKAGDTVTRGQIIGYLGNTGYVTGPHLHFTVFWTASISLKPFGNAGVVPVGVTVNPDQYL